MYDEFVGKLPAVQKATETFLVRGVRLPLYQSDNTLVKVIGNYYLKKENFVFFGSACSGKFGGIVEMAAALRNCTVLAGRDQFKTLNSKQKDLPQNIVCVDGFDFSEKRTDHLIFYNAEIPFEKLDWTAVHISGFYDYVGIFDPSGFKSYVESKVSHFPADFQYTVICRYPKKKKIEFVFGTEDPIKHLAITGSADGHSCVLARKPSEAAVKHFKDQGIAVVEKISSKHKTGKLFFYDIDVELVKKALDRIDHVVVVYTKSEFPVLREIYALIKDKDLEIPEFIKKL